MENEGIANKVLEKRKKYDLNVDSLIEENEKLLKELKILKEDFFKSKWWTESLKGGANGK
ncbi:MAG: hypothetical protein ACK4ND_17515 [Cytophagaceae bacterium]